MRNLVRAFTLSAAFLGGGAWAQDKTAAPPQPKQPDAKDVITSYTGNNPLENAVKIRAHACIPDTTDEIIEAMAIKAEKETFDKADKKPAYLELALGVTQVFGANVDNLLQDGATDQSMEKMLTSLQKDLANMTTELTTQYGYPLYFEMATKPQIIKDSKVCEELRRNTPPPEPFLPNKKI